MQLRFCAAGSSREAAKGCGSNRKRAAEGGVKAAERQKDLIGLGAKPPLRRAESRFAKPRKVPKGFNFVRAKLLFGCAESRFAEPRSSRRGSTDWYFLRRAKSTAKTRRGLRPSGLPGTIQISARYEILAEMTGVHQVTGRTGKRNLSGYRR